MATTKKRDYYEVLSVERTAKVGNPLTLTVWVADDGKLTTNSGAQPKNLGPPVTVTWSKYRGPGEVTFARDKPEVEKIAAEITSQAGAST